jgi:hypothetical protein
MPVIDDSSDDDEEESGDDDDDDDDEESDDEEGEEDEYVVSSVDDFESPAEIVTRGKTPRKAKAAVYGANDSVVVINELPTPPPSGAKVVNRR